ncbi:hypothetical protein C815_02075 [Firmicutes bacterium M10-2]|nr:hypothetical protein C815_02075 [Firmicutes bacterium M10-2]
MREIKINEIENFRIGNAQDLDGATGCTVILCEKGASAGVDVRGGGPATRETDLLRPENMVQRIHAVLLSGGSAFGLESSSGVMEYLKEKRIGFSMKDIIVPIVCQACLFDLQVGNHHAYPTKNLGKIACIESELNIVEQGNVGAGTGASVGKLLGPAHSMKSGLGSYALQCQDLKVGAIVAVNACGDVYEPNSKMPISGLYDPQTNEYLDSEEVMMDLLESHPHENTTIGCIITNGNLDKAQMNKVASMAQDALARTIRPVHTSSDGDTVFAMSCGNVKTTVDIVGILAVRALEQAIVNACKKAESAYGLISFSDFQKKKEIK